MTDQPLEPDEPRREAAAGPPPETKAAPPPQAERRLVRSTDDRVIAGLCGGLGRYLGVDPVILRIAAVLLVFAGGAGIVLYVIGWVAIPEEGETASGTEPPLAERTGGAVALGLIFVGLGAIFLADELWPNFLSWRYVWPIALIVVGVVVLLRSRR
jgi:phage shock protein C